MHNGQFNDKSKPLIQHELFVAASPHKSDTKISAVWAQQLSCVWLVRCRVRPSMLSPVFLIQEENSDPAHSSISGHGPSEAHNDTDVW